MNVLSLFNGMNTGRQALENVGIKVSKYYSSEIKPYAIELTQYHFPDTIQFGDINDWKSWEIDYSKIDMVLSGSPCQDLSIAGKRAGLNGPKSSLFWVFVEILNHIKKLNPDVLFLQENVGTAPIKDVGIMSRALGLYPCLINSSLLTAQLRSRYYWTNIKTKPFGMFGDIITDIPQPKDRKIYLKNIIEDGFTDKIKLQSILMSDAKSFGYKDFVKFTNLINRRLKQNKQIPNFVFVDREKSQAILESDGNNLVDQTLLYRRYIKGFTSMVFKKENEKIHVRPYTQTELERLQGFPDFYTSILSRNKAASLLGDGWTLPIIEHIFKFIKL